MSYSNWRRLRLYTQIIIDLRVRKGNKRFNLIVAKHSFRNACQDPHIRNRTKTQFRFPWTFLGFSLLKKINLSDFVKLIRKLVVN